MEIILVRHGESLFNQINNYKTKDRSFSGQSDVPLTELGRQQAQRLRELPIWNTVDQVYSSPLQRAYETAILAAGWKDIICDNRLKERSLGIFNGKSIQDFPEWLEFFDNHNITHSFTDNAPEGENYTAVEKRVKAFLAELLLNDPNNRVAIFSHFVAIRLMVKALLNLSNETTLKLKIINSSPLYFRGETMGNFEEINE
ncbi:histidine phosphatase family protein [Enterococcus sp. LJL120]